MFEDKRLGVPTRVGVRCKKPLLGCLLCCVVCFVCSFILFCLPSLPLPLDASYPSGQTFVPRVRLCFKASLRPSEFLFRASKIPARYKEQMFSRLS